MTAYLHPISATRKTMGRGESLSVWRGCMRAVWRKRRAKRLDSLSPQQELLVAQTIYDHPDRSYLDISFDWLVSESTVARIAKVYDIQRHRWRLKRYRRAKMKLVKHGEPGCGKAEIEGDAKFVNFMFLNFKSSGPGHYAELYDDDGKLVSTTNPQQ